MDCRKLNKSSSEADPAFSSEHELFDKTTFRNSTIFFRNPKYLSFFETVFILQENPILS